MKGGKIRDPDLLYLVFETSGHTYAFETLEEAGGTLEAVDLIDGHYIGAFSDQGEVITMTPGDLWVAFSPTGTYDQAGLRALITRSRAFSELADNPRQFASALWRST